MKAVKATLGDSEARRSSELFRAVEQRVVAVRKLLKALGQGQDRPFRGVMDDAVKLAQTIERLARFGRSRPAEEAVEIKYRIELLVAQLVVEVDQLIAS